MKGLAEEYIFTIVVIVVFILVSIGILLKLKIVKIETEPIIVDVRYTCSQYNNSAIGLDNFKTVVYGFLTDQCESLYAVAKERIEMGDIRSAVDVVDKKIDIIRLNECKLPISETHTFFYCCNDTIGASKNIHLIRKPVKKSNVLLCIT